MMRRLGNVGFALLGAGTVTLIAVAGIVLVDNGFNDRAVRGGAVLVALVALAALCLWDMGRDARHEHRVDLDPPEPAERPLRPGEWCLSEEQVAEFGRSHGDEPLRPGPSPTDRVDVFDQRIADLKADTSRGTR